LTSTSGKDARHEGGISILFENADVIAVSKPVGLATIPERGPQKESLHASVQEMIGQRLWVVHRLDKDASGVVLFSKNAASHSAVNDQFARREVTKAYLALVHGHMERDRGTVNRPIRPYGSGRMGVDDRRGKASSTGYEVERYAGPCTFLRAYPSTGRRHQIRVHFYSIGHPIVGDRRYGDAAVQKVFPRMMLHAVEISLHLPAGDAVTVACPVPESFSDVLRDITAYF
jgi:tRNA pseudouridine32 synthase/23S rRNA pseudouridine746 synthase